MSDPLEDAARKLGSQHGQMRAGWVDQFKLTPYAARNIIKGFEESHEGTLDICPNPLAGESADDPTPFRIIDEIANLANAEQLLKNETIDDAMAYSESILDVYEDAFTKAFWDHVITSANNILKEASA